MDSEQITENNTDTERILNIAIEAGRILLENGAEIFRVEETMERITGHYGMEKRDFYVLTNGIFATGNSFAAVRQISVSSGARLDKIVAVNQLSREIAEGLYTPSEAEERLEQIRSMRDKRPIMQILASGVGSAGFSVLFGGSLRDAAVAFAAGIILYIYILYVGNPHLSKIPGNIFGSALVTFICIFCYRLGIGEGLSHMVIGAVIPLIPGVEFANGVRDIAYGDYLSGFIRLLDAILVFVSIAIGVGVVFLIYRHAFGGTII